MSDFARPTEGFRFGFLGLKTNAAPDALPPGKYPLAINIRAYSDDHIRTRPGYTQVFAAGNIFTDIRAYAALSTDDLPRILARDNADRIYLDTGALVGTLAGAGASPNAAMIPFRPNASPQPWMYIANGSDYQKFSAPTAANAVTQRKVGIAEPQTAVDAVVSNWHANFVLTSSTFANSGTAGAVTNGTRSTESVVAAFQDPITPALYTIQVGGTQQYQIGEMVQINAFSVYNSIRDVFQPIPTSISILGIFYFAGSTGRCIIVPNVMSPRTDSSDESIYTQYVLSNLRRGALVKVGSEVCYVLSVTEGPTGQISIETSTVATHTTADLLSGVPAFQTLLAGGQSAPTGAILAGDWSFQVTTGVGLIASSIGNLFTLANASFQEDDYIHLSINVDNLSNLTEIKIVFDVNNGSADLVSNAFYFTIRPNDIQAGISNVLTQLAVAQQVTQRAYIDDVLAAEARNQANTPSSAQTATGNSQWAEILFPISALTRIGNDQSRTINNTSKVGIYVNCTGTVNVLLSSISIRGQFSPDVGDVGAPYKYRIRPRDSRTGVIGNPSPEMRYGVSPRREQVQVTLPTTYADSQADTWDIFRYGGSVTSYRFIGSVTLGSASIFLDNYDDSAAQEGDELDFDNFEPWPTIDLPLSTMASIVNGTIAVVSVPSPTNVLRYLPGTLIRLGGQNAYTLWTRPTFISGTNYLFQLVENAGAGVNVPVIIQEPILANQMLPYMWGPDASGTVFAVGDPLRPGTLYFAKNYNPDSAPDKYNQEIVSPSEPLLGGETVDGLAYVGSSERWWALYPTPDNPKQRYNVVQQPFPRGLAAPEGHCTDGQSIFWWAKDGIWSSSEGSLTDADLYNLFPHEGVPGRDIFYGPYTIQHPDYSQIAGARLTHSNGFLYASYRVPGGAYAPTLVYDIKRKAWSVDAYNVPMSCFYHVEQQSASGPIIAATLNPVLLMAGQSSPSVVGGALYRQADLQNDNGTPIACAVAVREFDGGDIRAPKQWGDFFVDLIPASAYFPSSGVSVTPMSLAAPVAAATQIPTSASRQRTPVSVKGVAVSDFLGLLIQWTDDFTAQAIQTKLFLWQPSFSIQPARDIEWFTFGTSFGLSGYMHIREIVAAWVSTAPITLQITSFDGQSPAAITIPSSGGAYQKQLFTLTANKGQLYKFHASSTAPFQFFMDDFEVRVGQWGRSSPYLVARNFGGNDARAAVV